MKVCNQEYRNIADTKAYDILGWYAYNCLFTVLYTFPKANLKSTLRKGING